MPCVEVDDFRGCKRQEPYLYLSPLLAGWPPPDQGRVIVACPTIPRAFVQSLEPKHARTTTSDHPKCGNLKTAADLAGGKHLTQGKRPAAERTKCRKALKAKTCPPPTEELARAETNNKTTNTACHAPRACQEGNPMCVYDAQVWGRGIYWLGFTVLLIPQLPRTRIPLN